MSRYAIRAVDLRVTFNAMILRTIDGTFTSLNSVRPAASLVAKGLPAGLVPTFAGNLVGDLLGAEVARKERWANEINARRQHLQDEENGQCP